MAAVAASAVAAGTAAVRVVAVAMDMDLLAAIVLSAAVTVACAGVRRACATFAR